MIGVIFSALKIIILLGFLVFIHELGHFSVAKICNVKVNEFAIGFGPVLLKWQGKETKYQLRLIPLGGFVSMEGEDSYSKSARSFSNIAISKRIAIVAAGGLVNILFAIIVFFSLQTIHGGYYSTKIESCEAGYAAEYIGIQPGDTIKKINGKNVHSKKDIDKIVSTEKENELTILVEHNGKNIEYKTKATKIEYLATGLYFKDENSTTIYGNNPKIDLKEKGLKIGDIIIAINGNNVENNVKELVSQLKKCNLEEKVKMTIRRNNENLDVELELIKEVDYKLGVNYVKVENKPLNNIKYAYFDTIKFTTSIADNLKELFSGKTKVDDLMGPVGISNMVVKTSGLYEFIYIITVISLSLGVTNLLPFPPLDGGKIVFLIIEAIIKRPIKEKVEIGIQLAGMAVLLLLSAYVMFNDIGKILF